MFMLYRTFAQYEISKGPPQAFQHFCENLIKFGGGGTEE